MNKAAIGSSFDEFLASEGILSETTAIAHKRVLAWQVEMAKRMRTSRTAVHRLLDPNNPSITLDTIDRAVGALGMKMDILIMPQKCTTIRAYFQRPFEGQRFLQLPKFPENG